MNPPFTCLLSSKSESNLWYSGMISASCILSPYGGFVSNDRCGLSAGSSGTIGLVIKSLVLNCIWSASHAFFALSLEISIIVGSISCPRRVCCLLSITLASAVAFAST